MKGGMKQWDIMKRQIHIWLRLGFALVLLSALAVVAKASRVWHPMGKYIGDAELIVVGDTEQQKSNLFALTVSIREVLKGDQKLLGQTVSLSHGRRLSTQDANVPWNGSGVGILLPAGWAETNRWPVLEAYVQPDEVEALRILVPICAIKNERDRLLGLRRTLASRNRVCEQEMFAQLQDMRFSSNYDVLTNLFATLTLSNQIKLVELVGQIGDLRGVPMVISASASGDTNLSSAAIQVLEWTFPGAPGVTTAFEQALSRKHLERRAAIYLAERRSDPNLKRLAAGQQTLWAKAHLLLESQQTNDARKVYLQILKDKHENYRMRVYAAHLLTGEASDADKEQIREALLPLLAAHPATDDYLVALQLAEILRHLHHPDCLPPLLPILSLTDFTSTRATWTACAAIRELDEGSRGQAAVQLVERLKTPPPKTVAGSNPDRYPLELIWVGTEEAFKKAEAVMDSQYATSWKSLAPLRALNGAKDEAAFLLDQLSLRGSLHSEATEWIVLRLGDLKEPRAVPDLVKFLTNQSDWRLEQQAADTLVAIGGTRVEEELMKLLAHPDENRVRRNATEAILRIMKNDRAAELCRKVLTEKDFGSKRPAYMALERFGTMNDLPLLARLSDFWTGDRTNHFWALTALCSVRERCKCDLAGPIKRIP